MRFLCWLKMHMIRRIKKKHMVSPLEHKQQRSIVCGETLQKNIFSNIYIYWTYKGKRTPLFPQWCITKTALFFIYEWWIPNPMGWWCGEVAMRTALSKDWSLLCCVLEAWLYFCFICEHFLFLLSLLRIT